MASGFDVGLEGVPALVTGASSGLGARFAQVLARHGAVVALAARRADRLRENVAAIKAEGGRAIATPMDVADPAAVRAAFDALEARAGPLGLLVNNAGVAAETPTLGGPDGDGGDDDGAFERVIAVNLVAAWRVARQGARRMAAHGRGGAIVNIASVLGLRVTKNVAAYAAAKAGLIQITKVMALELAARNIRVNALAPGWTSTEMNSEFLVSPAGETLRKRVPMGRFGAPEDLDSALLLLASPRSAFITGVALPVDGGHLVSSL